MNDQSMQSFADRPHTVELDARPEPIEFIPNQTAVVVVDLQNGYASPGGYRELNGQMSVRRVQRSRIRCVSSTLPARPD